MKAMLRSADTIMPGSTKATETRTSERRKEIVLYQRFSPTVGADKTLRASTEGHGRTCIMTSVKGAEEIKQINEKPVAGSSH